jgi:hypothetical protein
MQSLECRNLKEMLDSYLHGELSVETNHAVLRHLEQCPACRNEMAARRQLRERLRSAATATTLSPDARARLRARLREDTLSETSADQSTVNAPDLLPRESFFARFFQPFLRPRLPLAAAMIVLLAASGSVWFFGPRIAAAADLSREFMLEAIGDHTNCAVKFARNEGKAQMSDYVRQYDATYAKLDQIAELHSAGLRLRSVHLCSFASRQFAHLVYTRGDELISMLVTERDAKAMKKGVVPPDDGLQAGLQHDIEGSFNVSAYQTRRHIVLMVASLPESEVRSLAQRIAQPVSRHLREMETLPAGNHQ